MKPSARTALAVLFIAIPSIAGAAEKSQNCWVAAGTKFGIAPELLYAIAKVESGLNPKAREILDVGESIGIMQINSWWFPKLQGAGISREHLWDACTNIRVGAWILSQEIRRYGNTWTAVGAYNSGALTEKTKKWKIEEYKKYARRVHDTIYSNK